MSFQLDICWLLQMATKIKGKVHLSNIDCIRDQTRKWWITRPGCSPTAHTNLLLRNHLHFSVHSQHSLGQADHSTVRPRVELVTPHASVWVVQKLHPLHPGLIKNYPGLGGHFNISACFTVHELQFKRSSTGIFYLTTRVSHSHRSICKLRSFQCYSSWPWGGVHAFCG